jgi:cytochrome c oxidase cbb3-type subunit 3
VTAEGRTGMPKFNLTSAQLSDIAAFVHSFRVSGYDTARNRPVNIVVGDAHAGEAYFKSKCAGCHSVTGDLKGFGAKFTDPRMLQQTWLIPGGGGRFGGGQPSPVNVPPTTATITTASGQKVEGRLTRIDDFIVTITDADGMQHTFRRDGDKPKVEVHDPLSPHRELLKVYTDKDIHDLTAYLVTLK